LEKDLDPLHILSAKLFFYLDQVGSNSWVNVGHSSHNMLKGTNDNLMRALLSGRHLGSVRRIIELELEREFTQS